MTNYFEQQIKDHPEVAWALELLKPDPNYDPGVMKTYISETICIGLGLFCVSASNFLIRKPLYAGKYV